MTEKRSTGNVLSIKEAAERTGLAIRTIYKYTSEGRIPHIRIGSKLGFLDKDLNDFVLAHRVGGSNA